MSSSVVIGSKRGPKPKKWAKGATNAFKSFFVRRAEPLPEPERAPLFEISGAGLRWLFSSGKEDPEQVAAAKEAPVINVVTGAIGALVALGLGDEPGSGSCEQYFVFDEEEVPAGTSGAVPRVRGGTGDLQMRLSNGAFVWSTAHHCRPWRVGDGAPVDDDAADAPLQADEPPLDHEEDEEEPPVGESSSDAHEDTQPPQAQPPPVAATTADADERGGARRRPFPIRPLTSPFDPPPPLPPPQSSQAARRTMSRRQQLRDGSGRRSTSGCGSISNGSPLACSKASRRV